MTMRLRMAGRPCLHRAARNNRHIPFVSDHTGHSRLLLQRGRLGIAMTAHVHDTITETVTPAAARPARRADAGRVRLSQRDIDGLLLVGEHYGAPADLLGAALRTQEARLPAITARWRRAGYAATGRLGPGPGWYWLTRDGMTATGLGFPAREPSLGRLAHIRAVLAARLWLTAGPVWADGRAWWNSERRLRAGAARGWPGRACRGRGDPLALDRGQPVRRAGLGRRGRAHPQAAGPHHPDHERPAESAAVRAGDLLDRPARPPGGHPRRGGAAR